VKTTSHIAITLILGAVCFSTPCHAQDQPAPAPPKSAPELLADAQDPAIRAILEAARAESAQLRATALEAVQPLPRRALPLAQAALEDENPGVRFAALLTTGQLRLEALGRSAARLVGDPDPSVRAAAIYAAHRTGQDVNQNELPRLLQSDQVGVRANAVMVTGMMGDKSAVPMLREFARTPVRRASAVRQALLRLQFAEALVKLGEDGELEPIRAGMFSQEYEVRVLAVGMLGELGDHSMAHAMKDMLDNEPVELRLAAARSLALLGDNRGGPAAIAASKLTAADVAAQAAAFVRDHPKSEYAPIYQALLGEPEQQARVAALARGQSAFALSQIGGDDCVRALVALLDAPDPAVRLSAAAGVLRAAR